MYRLSKSVPRGYEYLSSRYSIRRRHKADVVQELPPAPYLHQEKNYSNVSPMRSKQKLIEARTYKSPLSERERILTANHSNIDNFFDNISAVTQHLKLNSKKLQKQWGNPGITYRGPSEIEPGTPRTLSEDYTTKPISRT